MVLEVKMPALSPTMQEGKIVSWNKNEGDKIGVGDVILEVETDKAVMEVEAQEKGVLGKILYQLNDVVEVNKTIALLLEKGETADVLKDYKISNDASGVPQEKQIEEKKDDIKDNISSTDDNKKTSREEKNKIFASPLAKSIAKQNSVDIATIASGSGPNGRIIKADVEKFLMGQTATNSVFQSVGRNSVEYIDIEPSGMRGAIARRLLESKQQIPHWYLKISANMEKFVEFRSELNKLAKVVDGKPEFKISANDIIVLAVAKAIKKNPTINSIWNDGKIRQYNNVDISVACSVEGGILTPVVKNADQIGLISLSQEVKSLVKKARDGKLLPNEYSGGAVSISNLGMYGVEEFISIINPPQSCIVAVGAIEDKVVVDCEKNIVVKPVCNICFSADHRVIDGAVLALFASDVKLFLENPAMMVA